MLSLIFSPYYDGNCHAGNPERNKCTLGTKYVGSLGLLNELELRTGLSHGEVTSLERTIAYSNAIRNVPEGDEPFYKQSFENDSLGVAQQLLCWRDALCMAGWNKDTKLDGLSVDGEKRLRDLQEIEGHFNAIGVGERWHRLLNTDLDALLPKDLEIKVDMKMDLLPPVIRKVLYKTNRAKMSEEAVDIDGNTLGDFADKFVLYQFAEQNDVYQWAALQEQIKADVYINEDNFTFNQVLKSVGKPLVSASVDGATDLSQLLKSGISLFRAPVNYTNLTNYLGIFRHPIDYETRSTLLYHLKKVGGFGERVNEDGTVTKIEDAAKSYPDFWGMWEYGTKDKNGKDIVSADKVKKFCEELMAWAKTAEDNAAAEKNLSPMTGTQVYAQLLLLQERITHMLSFLKDRSGDIGNDELDKAATLICQGGSVNTDFARLGSADMLSDLKGLAAKVNAVIWMDCVRKPRPRYSYAFLNPSDIKKLQEKGLDIPNADLEIRASDFAERLAVSRASKIFAWIPQRKDGERTDENLLVTELRCTAGTKIQDTPALPGCLPVTLVPADTQKVEHRVDAKLFENIEKPAPADKNSSGGEAAKSKFDPVGYQRGYESFSSLSELIGQPFDYVLDYLYNMKDEDKGNLSTVEGNVAHAVIDRIVKDSTTSRTVDTAKFLGICHDTKDLEQRTEQAILDVGAILLQPENEMECNIFRRLFVKKSVPTLVKIIEDNDLEVEGSEKEFTTVLNDSEGKKVFNFNAQIDCLLKRKNPETNEFEYFIFDFKWTGRPSKREKEMEGCKELQLALYQKIAEENEVSPVVMRGYYLLKQARLLTTYTGFKPDDSVEIVKQKVAYDIFGQAAASYRERIHNLKEGRIEEGEEMKGPEFDDTAFIEEYKKNTIQYYLDNGLEYSVKSKKMKAQPKNSSYGRNIVLKGKIK